jgi:uncharacterized protein YidB (DUF937 family)
VPLKSSSHQLRLALAGCFTTFNAYSVHIVNTNKGDIMDLTKIIGQFAGAGGGAMTEQIMKLVQDSGGVNGLVSKFQSAGFGEQVKSWLGDGQNLPINAEGIQKVLGNPMITGLASKLGMDSNAVAGHLATALPQIINALSSGGNLTDVAGKLLGQVAGGKSPLDFIKGFFSK